MTKIYSSVSQLSVAIVLSVLSSALAAQVYQTHDKDGNPVFSDQPSAGASEVEIQTTNSATSVQARPESRPTTQAKSGEKKQDNAPVQNKAAPRYEVVDPYLNTSNKEDDRRRLNDPDNRPENRPVHRPKQPVNVVRPANRH